MGLWKRRQGSGGLNYQSAALTLVLLLLLHLLHLLQHLPGLFQLLLSMRGVEPLPEMSKTPIIPRGAEVAGHALRAVVT